MTDLDYLTHLARESARFAEVITQTRPEVRVPTCPDWDAGDLLWHLGEVQWLWGTIVGRGLTRNEDVEVLDDSGRPSRPSDRDHLLEFFRRSSVDLQHNLSAVSPETAAWTWSDEQSVGFIRRRQAHEALIHRLDAELTAGDRTPMDADLCTDGVDEVLHIMYGGTQPWGRFTPDPTQTVAVHTTDTDRFWLVTLGQFTGTDPDGTTYDELDLAVGASGDGALDTGEPAAATVRGAAADLNCWLWHRPPVGEVERSGDRLVLERLDRTIAEGIT